MTVDFSSYRNGGGQDLTISTGHLGLIQLADEEFEVHGPRLNRYAMQWAFYLGNHWSYQREAGEPQLTFNYTRAFIDYIINFTFGKGVSFRAPRETDSIVPDLLKRVWETDNNKPAVLHEMGQQGGVTGDVFVKVAYSEPHLEPAGPEVPGNPPLPPGVQQTYVPGRVRILPLNSAFCFPEWHPHDKDKLIRFKLKYRFWGTAPEGTRRVFTYTEIITDTTIEEWVNDELIRSDPNPLGTIPVVHIPNMPVSGSPWGLPDCTGDFLELNREYNEKMADVSDIINYHAAPVTIVKGAKVSQLEKGPRKVWGGLPKDADVYNLSGVENIDSALNYVEMLKRGMHEMVGIPETALGQMQPISNTSGVALSIQFQPLMNRYSQKIIQYSQGIEKINALILKTLALKEPLSLQWDATVDSTLKEGQVAVLDPEDPITYRSTCHWPAPLPVDALIKLNEIQVKLALSLESREGALRDLGEEFPDEKLAEIRAELMDDVLADGALNLLKTQVEAEIMQLTGMVPGNPGDPAQLPPTDGGGGPGGPGGGMNSQPQPQMPAPVQPVLDQALLEVQGEASQIRNDLVTRAYGTKLPQRRSPERDGNG